MTRRSQVALGFLPVLLLASGCGSSPKPATSAAPPTSSHEVGVAPTNPSATASPTKTPIASLSIVPTAARIEPGDPGLQLLVSAKVTAGRPGELDQVPVWSTDPAGIVQVDGEGYVRPIKPGKAKVTAARGGASASAEVEVASSTASSRPWDFAADVVPILTRAGCNTGGCHGKADGQNGFHLSLFGYDPEGDHRAITRDASGRRVSPFSPDDSLILRKASGSTPHEGGQRIAPGSEAFQVVREWIAAGAPESRGKVHGGITSLRVEPFDLRLDGPGTASVRVVAQFADGHTRDVTRLAQFKINDDSAASVTPEGRVTLLRRAETDLIVRYGSQVVASRISTVINPDLKFDFGTLPRKNVVDAELFKRLGALKVPPSPRATDAAFLRRVTLDLTGQQPDTAAVREFLSDTDPDKRAKKVDELLKREDFVRFWQIKLGDMLQISQARFGAGAGPYNAWLGRRLKENAPWDAMVRELLTSLGDPATRDGGPINYALDGIDPKVAAEQTAQRFLGLRLRCAQCHDHPFDVWTQDDYFGLAAIFAKVGRNAGPGAMMNRPRVSIDPKGSIEHLRTKKPAEMRLLDHSPVKVADKDDPRKSLADWMTRPDNPYFARAAANFVWAQFFGRGIAEPADDLSRANPPVHPELLDALAKHFVENKFDLRELIRTVATSEAYGLASTPIAGNEHDTRLFSHHLPRPLTAHQMADALSQVTGVPLMMQYSGSTAKVMKKAIEINEPSVANTLLDTFGRCPRTVGCSSVATPSLSLRQSLLLIGGDAVDGKVSSLNGYLSNLLSEPTPPDPGDLVALLYFKTLCRPPTDEELSHWSAELKGATSYREAAEDLFWALLNSKEFAFNH
jgi:Protein of unknown function (DUF1553)/Protein of unknown function (DUF1549)